MRTDELHQILVACHYDSLDGVLDSKAGERCDDIIRLVMRHFQEWNVISPDNLFDDGDRLADDFGRLFALCLVLLVGLVAEGGPGGVEGHADVRGVFFLEHLFERVDKAHDGRCVEALGVDARVLDERVVSPVNQRIGVEQKEFVV